MNTYKLFNQKTKQTLKIVKADNIKEVVKKYNLATREHINTRIEILT